MILDSAETNLGSADARIRSKARERVLAAVHQASGVGSAYVCFAPVQFDTTDGPLRRYEEAYHYALEALLALRHEAGLRGVRMLVEVAANGFLISPSEAREFLDEVNSPWAGASLNLATFDSITQAIDWIETLTHRLCAIRIDGPAAGELDWESIGRALAAERFDGVILAPTGAAHDNDNRLIRLQAGLHGGVAD